MGKLLSCPRRDLKEAKIVQMERITRYKREIIIQMHRMFQEKSEDGKLGKEEFITMVQTFFPHMNKSSSYATAVYDNFDANKDGKLTFSEFFKAIALTTCGTAYKKLKCIIQVSLKQKENQINFTQAVKILKNIRDLLSVNGEEISNEDIIKRAENYFTSSNIPNTGMIELEHFKRSVQVDPQLHKVLESKFFPVEIEM